MAGELRFAENDVLVVLQHGEAVIASGGVGTLEHMVEGVRAGASAVLAASIFHFGTYTIAETKAYLAAHGIPVRPTHLEAAA